MTQQTVSARQDKLSDYERRQAGFAKVRALIMKVVNAEPGLTNEEIGISILTRWHFLPEIDNRVRDLRRLGWVVTVKEEDGRLHIYPKQEPQP